MIRNTRKINGITYAISTVVLPFTHLIYIPPRQTIPIYAASKNGTNGNAASF